MKVLKYKIIFTENFNSKFKQANNNIKISDHNFNKRIHSNCNDVSSKVYKRNDSNSFFSNTSHHTLEFNSPNKRYKSSEGFYMPHGGDLMSVNMNKNDKYEKESIDENDNFKTKQKVTSFLIRKIFLLQH